MAKYNLGYRIIASYFTTVEADDYETAVKLGRNNYYDADFGEAEDADAELIFCKEE